MGGGSLSTASHRDTALVRLFVREQVYHTPQDYKAGSKASSYSVLKRPINSAAGRILPMLPTPCPEPQISFHAFGLARSPEVSVPKLILEGSEVGRFSGSMPAATTDGFR